MKKRFLICATVFTLVVTLLASCGATAKDEAYDMMEDFRGEMTASPSYSYDAPTEDMAFGYENGYGGKYYDKVVEMPETESVTSSTGANNGDYKEKIIKNVNLSAQTKEYEKALDGILTSLAQNGGYEESVTSSGRSYYAGDYYTRNARMTLRVPAANLDAFLGEIGGLINVTSQTSSQSNVTAQYYDTVARLGVLEAEKTAYEEMLKMAKDVTEVLEIRDRLYQTIQEIEASKTKLNVYDNKVSYSTVVINLEEVREYVEVPTAKVTFGQRISNTFKRSWKNFADNCQDFAVWLVGALPTFAVIIFIAGAGTAIALIINHKSKKAREAKKNENK